MKFADRKVSDVEWLKISIESIDSYFHTCVFTNDITVPEKENQRST